MIRIGMLDRVLFWIMTWLAAICSAPTILFFIRSHQAGYFVQASDPRDVWVPAVLTGSAITLLIAIYFNRKLIFGLGPPQAETDDDPMETRLRRRRLENPLSARFDPERPIWIWFQALQGLFLSFVVFALLFGFGTFMGYFSS